MNPSGIDQTRLDPQFPVKKIRLMLISRFIYLVFCFKSSDQYACLQVQASSSGSQFPSSFLNITTNLM